jgi:phospholipid transport system transporter-binding protein
MTDLYSLSINADGTVSVAGELTFATANSLLTSAPAQFDRLANLDIDLAGVTRSDSAGLALLIDWVRYAKVKNKQIVFHHMPTQLLAIAGASGLDEILSID